jgi:hypothetical protein
VPIREILPDLSEHFGRDPATRRAIELACPRLRRFFAG